MKRELKILIGYDGSKYCDAAIDDLTRAGLPPKVKALVVSVGDAPTIPPLASQEVTEKAVIGERAASIVAHANEQAAEALRQAGKLALRASKRLKSHFPSWQISSEVLAGTPAEELIAKAAHWKSDLLVVGSQGRSAIGRLILGSVSLEVARESNCSVRIGREPDYETKRKEIRILVGIDGPKGLDRTLRKLLGRDWPVGTELRVVAVADGESAILTNKLAGSSGAVVTNKIVELAVSKGLIVSAGILQGDPKRTLLAEAVEWGADCIVVGSSRSKTKPGFFESSVSLGLAADAECTIEIVR
ncbi:MAG TPA: universal stress protein [Pyrinomonadaceae bacterium]|nr:universal stress protein [Pyrinomonadaceae bacterium]